VLASELFFKKEYGKEKRKGKEKIIFYPHSKSGG
jgi:hypothetical protein